MIIDSPSRSLAKTLSWRVTATLTTIILVYLFTGQVATALAVGGIEVFAKMAIYYLHERGWEKLKFGRREVKPTVIWMCGYSGSGKGQLAQSLVEDIKSRGYKVEFLNGLAIRNLFPEVGFSEDERTLHIKRVGLLASQLEKHGVFVVASFLSPDREARDFVRQQCQNFVEVHVTTPIEECRKRDPKGLYAKADKGLIKNLAGVDFEFQPSPKPEFSLDLSQTEPGAAKEQILRHIGRISEGK